MDVAQLVNLLDTIHVDHQGTTIVVCTPDGKPYEVESVDYDDELEAYYLAVKEPSS